MVLDHKKQNLKFIQKVQGYKLKEMERIIQMQVKHGEQVLETLDEHKADREAANFEAED